MNECKGKVMFELDLLPPINCHRPNERNLLRNCETSKEVTYFEQNIRDYTTKRSHQNGRRIM